MSIKTFLFTGAAVIFFGWASFFFFSIFPDRRDEIALLAWREYRIPAAALFLNKSDAELAMQIGNYYFNGGAYDLEKARRAYEKALRADPKIFLGHYQLARILFVEGNYGAALEEINKELSAYPENLRSLYVRGLILGYQKDFGRAENDFRRFILWAPSEWAGYNDLAWVLMNQAKYADAGEVIRAAFGRVPEAEKNPWLWNALGVAELNLKSYEAALFSFSRALELAETLTDADWRKSYPGNNPDFTEEGISAFREAVSENLRRTREKLP